MSSAATVIEALNLHYVRQHPGEVAEWLSELSARRAAAFIEALSPAQLTAVWDRLPLHIGHALFARLPMELGAVILDRGDPGRAALHLRSLTEEQRAAYLAHIDAGLAKELRRLMNYPPDTAGAIMDPVVPSFRAHMSAQDTLKYLRRYRGVTLRSVLVADEEGHLVGVVDIQELALAHVKTSLGQLARPAKTTASVMTTREEIAEILETHKITELPVLDAEERVVGVVRYEGLISAVQDESSADIQTMVGVSRDERSLSTIWFKVRKRLPWLQINLLTAFLAAAVVGMFESTIAQFTALAVLLPIVAGQAGNTGAQALAVTMRGLALREISPRHWWKISFKETSTALINGVVVAITTAVAVYVWSDSLGLAAVIGSAMVISMVAAGLAGAVIPLTLTLLDQDPAQSSSIVLTTVTDVVGFMTFLGIATLAAGFL